MLVRRHARGAATLGEAVSEGSHERDTMCAATLAAIAPHLCEALQAAPLVAALYDEHDVLRWANDSYAAQFLRGLPLPVSFADVMRHGHRSGFGVKIDSGDVERFLRDILPRRRSLERRGFEADLIGGEWLWMTETLLPSGWLLCIGSIITPLKHSERTLRHARDQALIAAQTDALTGAPNRRHVVERGQELLASRRASDTPLSVAVIDLDHFKRINDLFGHEAGDRVLQRFVTFATSLLRDSDVLGRLGGEEFLVLLPNAQVDDARRVVERLRTRLPAVEAQGQAITYTFSAGIAQAQPHESWSDWLNRADRALYRAKTLGRARSEVAT